MSDIDLEGALADWAHTQDAGCRAATLLLIDHGLWLRNRQFVDNCVFLDDGTHWVYWWRVKELLDASRLPGTNSELAILRFAVQLADDALGLSSLDRINKDLIVDALAHALGVG